jgi:hypothetical protein
MNTTRRIRNSVGIMAVAAGMVSTYSVIKSHMLHLYFAAGVLALAALTSRMKVKLPGINGNMSVNLPFLLTAIVNLSSAEAVVITGVSTFVQCWPKKGAKLKPEQTTFNLSMMTFATCLANLVFHVSSLASAPWSMPLALALATASLLLGQTVPVAAIVAISEGKLVAPVWRNIVQLSFPYYVVSAGIASMLQMVGSHMGWPLALGVFPVMYGMHASYRFCFNRMAETAPVPILARAAHA